MQFGRVTYSGFKGLAASGCSWLLLAAPGCFGCSWLLLVALGCCWLLLAASGCFLLLLAAPGCSVLSLYSFFCFNDCLGSLWLAHVGFPGPTIVGARVAYPIWQDGQ